MDKLRGKESSGGKGMGGEVRAVKANESDKESVPPFSYHPLLLVSCAVGQERERERGEKEEGKK